MRPEFDKQFDSLLREHARRAGAAPRDGGPSAREGHSGGREVGAAAHLDADELSAFAENALPVSARARHTAHLVECGDCRQLVSQIALAVGVADEIERREPAHAVGLTAAAVPSSSPAWRERLASLFRPGAWRYAMPLAALLVVSAGVLLLMTGKRRGELGNLAAGGEKARPGQAAEMHHPATQPQSAGSATTATSQNTATNPAPTDSDKGKAEGRSADDAPSAPGGGAQGTRAELAKSAPADAAAPAATFAAAPVSVTASSPVPPPAARQPRDLAAAAPQPTPVPEELKDKDNKAAESKEKDRYDERNAAQARKRGHGPMRNMDHQPSAGNRQAEEAPAERGAKSEDDASRKPDTGAPRRARSTTAPSARAEGESRREKSGAGRGDDGGGARGIETRSVGGRRFRREEEVWVDTAYRPTQATVIVGRGSEQYRSLVGDEPELGRIANTLGGEVIVVWKGRAYRIKP